jgi:hypothetical protein
VKRPQFDANQFIKAVLSDEPLIAVLRGQMFIEAGLEQPNRSRGRYRGRLNYEEKPP